MSFTKSPLVKYTAFVFDQRLRFLIRGQESTWCHMTDRKPIEMDMIILKVSNILNTMSGKLGTRII